MTETSSITDSGSAASEQSVAPLPVLSTKRLTLRAFDLNDAPVIQQLLQCKQIAANTRSIEHPYPDGAAKIWIEKQAELWNTGKSAVFAICIMKSAELVGAVGLEINEQDENAELGYWIAETQWGNGLGTEAAKAVVGFGFEQLGLHKIYASHYSRNPASGRVLEKIGMQREGELRGHMKKWGVFEDVIYYGILSPPAD